MIALPCNVAHLAGSLRWSFLVPVMMCLSRGVLADSSTALTVAPDLPVICTDRPTKANYACAVEAGHFQYEADLVISSTLDAPSGRVTTWLIGNPTLKYGIGQGIDLEASVTALEIVHTPGRTVSGQGDLYLRVKDEFINTAGGVTQMAIIPFVKAPTAASGLGNGAVEGGAIAPLNVKLSDTLTLTTAPELDLNAHVQGSGHHLNTAQLINIAYAWTPRLTLYGELWADWDFDPGGMIHQSSFDGAITYLLTAYLQLDAGFDIGLNRSTATQLYLGISQKF
ncbi:MAG TPA: transporter [Steroidobacteraceae bacterium]|nr:transporter [Steroidobacteraceae bacterium]